MNNQSNIISWLKKRHTTISIFVALMVNLMVFSQPLEQILNQRIANLSAKNYYPSHSSYNNYTPTFFPKDNVTDNNQYQNSVAAATQPQTNSITSTNIPVKNIVELSKVDGDVISTLEKQGIIGKSENFPIDDPMDNVFSFEMLSDVKTDKDIYLTYELFGLADASQATKSINSQLATGGLLVKTNKEWTNVEEKIDPSQLLKGKNHVFFTTSEDAKHQYMVRGLRLVYKDKLENKAINFYQKEAISYDGMLQISGYVSEPNINEVKIENQTVKVINGQFEAIVHNPILKTTLEVSYTNAANQSISESITVKQLIEKPTAIYKEIRSLASVSKKFLKSTTNTLNFAGATLKVDSLNQEIEEPFSITGLSYKDMPTLSQEMVNVTADYKAYRMLPSGTHFEKSPAKISIKYDESKLPSGYTAKDIKTFYFDNDQKKWMALAKDTLLHNTKEIVSKTTHFTDFINGIIKVPESPETGSYTPTSIKDIKAADPTAGVVSIAPPTPNNMGTVNTSFPIKLPAGRAGMQPSLSVSYNSEGGNGWMGLGWDLSIPGVSLDTRWGAPRYDPNLETEIYSLGGMLTLNAGTQTNPNYTNPHRTDNIGRQADRQFYPRIEGSYAQIIRHGNHPNNYWWEVTDKTGSKSFYGGYTGVGVINEAVIRTGNNLTGGNISYWGLYRTEDTNGNYVEYIYDDQNVTINGPGAGGKQFYIKEIRYTRHTSEGNILPENYYKITFNRNVYSSNAGGGSTAPRSDVQINAKNGVVQVTKDLLAEISVDMVRNSSTSTPINEHIRSYRFGYNESNNEGLFYKTLLTSISEYDASGDLFYRNTMEYENSGSDGTPVSNSSIFESTTKNNWDGAGNGITGNLFSSFISGEFSNEGSVLGASKSSGGGGNLFVGAGFPCSWTRLFNIGINGGYSNTKSEVLISFTDINGDGLPDKVFKNSNGLFFRPNYGLSGFGNQEFINGISKISESSTDSYSVGTQASLVAFVGYTYNKSISTTKTYFSDVNGDGLIDLVDRGNIKLNQTIGNNYLNSVNFNQNTSTTSNPVGSGIISPTITNNIVLPTLTQINDENPLHDIVKVWTAPKTGTITITGNARLNPYPASTTEPYPAVGSEYYNDHDGVRLSIQKSTSNFPSTTPGSILKDETISPTFTGIGSVNNSLITMSLPAFTVNKGDRIYFRVQSKNEGSYDRVEWNPSITYSGADEVNIDNISYYSSAANEGFILCGTSPTIVPQAGPISITWPNLNFAAGAFSDNISFRIEQGIIDPNTSLFQIQQTYATTISQNFATSFTPSSFSGLPTSVPVNSAFKFYVSSNSNIDWKAINWQPIITQGTNTLHAVVDYSIYAKRINITSPKVNNLNTSPIIIKPVFNVIAFNGLAPGYYTFKVVVKNSNRKVIGISTNDIAVNVDSSLIASLSNSDPNFYNFVISENITPTIFVELYTNYEKAADIGALTTEPIKVEVLQASNINLPNPQSPNAYTIPTLITIQTTYINGISFGGANPNPNGFNVSGQLATPYYQNLNEPPTTSFPLKSYLTNTIQSLVINTIGTNNPKVGIWIDWNKDGIVNNLVGQEFYVGQTLNNSFSSNITIPSLTTLQDGLIKVRVRAGLTGTTDYSETTFNDNNIAGTVRDFWINVISTTPKGTVKDIYSVVENKTFGQQYRGWGEFVYNGGIKIQRGVDLDGNNQVTTVQEKNTVFLDSSGNPVIEADYGYINGTHINPIDEGVLNNNDLSTMSNICSALSNPTPEQLQACLLQNSSGNVNSRRFFSLMPDESWNHYYGANHNINVDEFNFSASRYGVKNIKTIYTPPVTGGDTSTNCSFIPLNHGISLINKGDGDSIAGGVTIPVGGGNFGANISKSNSFNWAETSFMDMNGDRYPDILTENNIQFTKLNGALAETKNLGFSRVSTGTSSSIGSGASGTFNVTKTPESNNEASSSQGTTAAVAATPDPPLNRSASVNGNIGEGTNSEKTLWIDMNGDGLPDRVIADGDIKVQLNLGYQLGPAQVWQNGTNELIGAQSNFSGGVGYSFADNTIGGGLSVAASKAWTEKNIQDVNGDGLPDLLLVSSVSSFSYKINTGNSFSSISNTSSPSGYINFSRGTSEGINGSYTQAFPIIIPFIPPLCFQLSVGGGLNFEDSFNRTENILDDINGDGYVDILNAGGGNAQEGDLIVRLSKIGNVNALKKVNTPLGGSWEVAYVRDGNTFDMPQSKWIMNKVTTFDAFTQDETVSNGNTFNYSRTVTTVKYENPYHDRREREFFGYEKVFVNQHPMFNNSADEATNINTIYRYSVQEFHNKNYYLKGAVKREALYEPVGTADHMTATPGTNDILWTENKTKYGIFKPSQSITYASSNDVSIDVEEPLWGAGVIHEHTPGSMVQNFICTDLDDERLYVTPLVSVKRFTEGNTGLKFAITAMEAFDAFGNITKYRDYGEGGEDVTVSEIEYYTSIAGVPNSIGFPFTIRVRNNLGILQRERVARYYNTSNSGTFGSPGDLREVETLLNGANDRSTVRMHYDPIYGNLSRVIHLNSRAINSSLPDTDLGENGKFFREYFYDDVVNTYPVRVTDAFGYESETAYNYLFGTPIFTKDMNHQPMRTRIDDRGRPIEITGPYELFLEGLESFDNAWTIRFQYQNSVTPINTIIGFQNFDQYGNTLAYSTTDLVKTQNSTLNANDTYTPDNATANLPHRSLTRHYDPEFSLDPNNPQATTNQILTVTLADGFGSPVQVKKMTAIFDGTATVSSSPNITADNNLVWLIPGKVKADTYGRATESYYPTTVNFPTGFAFSSLTSVPGNAYTYVNEIDTVEPTLSGGYDVLDRPSFTKLPGEVQQTTMTYGISGGRFETVITNELGQVQKSYTDIKGRTLETIQESTTTSGNIVTQFRYDNLSQLEEVEDVAGNITQSFYDLAGRRTRLQHPDNGVTTFTYDRASNLIERRTSNLLAAGGSTATPISYKYNYGRLEAIEYPNNPENNVKYFFGEPTMSSALNDNAIGRLWYMTDASGTQYFEYGRLGEVVKNRRSVAVPGDRVYWFQTEWDYDTWNRVSRIKYPDEEVVRYHYNRGGELHAMTSSKPNASGNQIPQKDIISQLGYDKFGQRTYLRYGNGTETTYSYEDANEKRRRLVNMQVKQLGSTVSNSGAGAGVTPRTFVNNKYNYDALSNILSVQNNTVALPTDTQIGGRSIQNYTYDDLNRLTTATGTFLGRNDQIVPNTGNINYASQDYALTMSYDNQHNILAKNQLHRKATTNSNGVVQGAWSKVEKSSYGLVYEDYNTAGYTVDNYAYNQPHAPRKIIDQPDSSTPNCCDAANDPRVKIKTYEYDHNGNQTKVLQSTCNTPIATVLRENLWDEENRLRAIDLNPEATALHPIAIYTYDAGGERIIKHNSTNVAIYENALKVGEKTESDFMIYPSGMLVARPASDGTGGLTYTKHYFAGTQRVSSKIGTTTNLGKFLEEWQQQEQTGPSYPAITTEAQMTKAKEGADKVYTAFGINYVTPIGNTSFVPIAAFTPPSGAGGLETEHFFFHPDHLGSSNYITNFAGNVSQHSEYFAFGETFIEEHLNSHNSPYKYNGKELDEESGLYYYGARYYDPRISIWLSVDPLAELFPNQSPYNYCFNNPINLTDPTGMAPEGGGDGDPPKKGWDLNEVVVTSPKPKEGQSRHFVTNHPKGNGGIGYNKYYHEGTGWMDKDDYYESWRGTIRAIGQGQEGLDALDGVTNDEVYLNLVLWAQSAYEYYGGEVPKARGNIDFDNTFFGIGTGVKPLRLLNLGKMSFWSGEGTEKAAILAGYSVLGGTRAGKNAIKLTLGMDRSQSGRIWDALSKTLAKSFKPGQTAHVHITKKAFNNPSSTWNRIEKPNLAKGVKIKYHWVK